MQKVRCPTRENREPSKVLSFKSGVGYNIQLHVLLLIVIEVEIEVPSSENRKQSEVLSFKLGVSKNMAFCASPAARESAFRISASPVHAASFGSKVSLNVACSPGVYAPTDERSRISSRGSNGSFSSQGGPANVTCDTNTD